MPVTRVVPPSNVAMWGWTFHAAALAQRSDEPLAWSPRPDSGLERSSLSRRLLGSIIKDVLMCSPVCRLVIRLESMSDSIGPVVDALYVPLRVVGGCMDGIDGEKPVVGGSDIAVMRADERLVHHGSCVVLDPQGDTILWFDGASRAGEGAYDDLLDGTLPSAQSRLTVRVVSANPTLRPINREPLLGFGSFDGDTKTLDIIIHSFVERRALAT